MERYVCLLGTRTHRDGHVYLAGNGNGYVCLLGTRTHKDGHVYLAGNGKHRNLLSNGPVLHEIKYIRR